MKITDVMTSYINQFIVDRQSEISNFIGRSAWREYTDCFYNYIKEQYTKYNFIQYLPNNTQIKGDDVLPLGEWIARCKITLWNLWVQKLIVIPRPVIRYMLLDCIKWQDKNYEVNSNDNGK